MVTQPGADEFIASISEISERYWRLPGSATYEVSHAKKLTDHQRFDELLTRVLRQYCMTQ